MVRILVSQFSIDDVFAEIWSVNFFSCGIPTDSGESHHILVTKPFLKNNDMVLEPSHELPY